MAVDAEQLVVGGATVAIGAFGTSTTDIGYIKSGITQTPTIDLFTIEGIEQLPVDPEAWITHRNFELSFTILEPTRANIIYAWDLPDAVVGTGPWTLDIITTLTHTPTELEIDITGIVPGASRYTRTVTYWKCVLSTPAPMVFSKGQETNLECTFKCLFDHENEDMVGQFSDANS